MSTILCADILSMSNEALQDRKASFTKAELLKAFLQMRKQPPVSSCDEIYQKLSELIDSKLNALMLKLDNVVQDQAELRSKVEIIEGRLRDFENHESQTMKDVVTEIEQRVTRKNNVIISGFQEYATGSVEERAAKDKAAVSLMLDHLGIDTNCVKTVRRLGRLDSKKPRIIQLVCNSFEEKQGILKCTRYLHSIDVYKGVFINPDQTKMQRRESFMLREELRRRRLAGEDVVIHRGSIVEKTVNPGFP